MTAECSEGKFITLEGGEGAGKSTSREFIVELLTANQILLFKPESRVVRR